LDSSFQEVSEFISRLFALLINEEQKTFMYRDYKTIVQQISQNRFKETPHYTLIREYGPDHDKTFEIELSITDKIITAGTGKNKKEAEQQAAEKALEALEKLTTPAGD
jgi:dsRNA-specific ribonuclease